MSTKDKILNESLKLFNNYTYEMSTTSTIAEKSDVLEGSLWYHFNSKTDIVSKHLTTFLDSYKHHKLSTKKSSPLNVIQGLFNVYEVIWDYRYLFRDSFNKISKKNHSLFEKIVQVNQSVDKWAKETVLHSRSIGMIVVQDNDVDSIVEISLIIGRYWLDFSMKKYPSETDSYLRTKGINLIIKSLYPHLSEDSKKIMDSIYEPSEV